LVTYSNPKKCKNDGCDVLIKWKYPYTKGDKPLEHDGAKHNCKHYKGGGDWKGKSKYGGGKYYPPLTKDQLVRCPYCKGSNYGWCRKDIKGDLERHIEINHPNKEYKWDSDFVVDKTGMMYRILFETEKEERKKYHSEQTPEE